MTAPRPSAPLASRWLAAASVAALLLTGCGGDGDDPEPTAAPTPTASPTAAAPEPTEAVEYVDDDGFAITFPAGWEVQPDVGGAEVAALPPGAREGDFGDNLSVILEDTGSEELTLEAYLDSSVEGAPAVIVDFTLVEREVVGDVGLLEFTGIVQNRELHFLTGTTISGTRAYTATLTATRETFAERAAEARAAILSLRATG